MLAVTVATPGLETSLKLFLKDQKNNLVYDPYDLKGTHNLGTPTKMNGFTPH